MTVGRALPGMRPRLVAVAIAGAVAVAILTVAADAQAQAPRRDHRAEHPFHRRYLPSQREPMVHPAPASMPPPAPIMRTASSPSEFSDRQRSGHMTPEERRLLRQHIEDAVRELYKR